MKRVCVIGAGAAGLMAACTAACGGNEVIVVEKNEKAGKKIYITGKGRCNVTNDVAPEDFFPNVVRNPKFLYGCIWSFPPSKLMQLLEEGGLPLKVERGNRVFPASDKASDVTKCLEHYCRRSGVTFSFNEKVEKIERLQSTMFDIITDKREIEADAVIVCTGGLSYPATGSSGDGLRFAKEFGLALQPARPALVGIECDMTRLDVQGLSLKNVRLSALRGGKELAGFFGEMLFTHFGISGPIALTLSSLINRENLSDIALRIDLKPALDAATLDKRVLRDLSAYSNRQMAHAVKDLLPRRLILPVLEQADIAAGLPANSLTKGQRERLVGVLKGFSLRPLRLRPIEEGIVTSGGVDVREIDPKTMECKKVPGLYFCGEVLDVDALTGGFNLQIAFSTGYAAGKAVCAQK